MDHRATILLYLELLLALGILYREGLMKTLRQKAVVLVMVGLAFVLRYCCMTYETLDYQDWIRVWIESLRQTGAWAGLGQEIWSCNYNVPYLYFLAWFSGSDIYDLYLVKLLSIFFDVCMAAVVMKLVGHFTENPARRLTGFIGVLWLPSVYLNGAIWGQCDVIYAFFALLSIYLLLTEHPGWSVAAIAVSISFKLQGIFLLPVYMVYLIAGRVRLRHLLVFPLTYILTILPAVLAGRSFTELLFLYISNTGTIGDGLNYNSSSLYALFDFSGFSTSGASTLGIMLAFLLCADIFVWMLLREKDIDDRVLLCVGLLFCIGVPFFLPHMHDRYFFMADVLSFALAVIAPVTAPAAVLVSFGSLLGYHAYLKTRYLLPMRFGAVAMLLALLVVTVYTIFSLNHEKKVLTNPGDLV